MKKLSDVITELEGNLDRHRIWTELRNFLRRFADDELSNREKIRKDDGTEVSPDSVAAVIQEITEEKLGPIETRIEEIQNLEIKDGEKKVDAKKAKAGAASSSAESASSNGGEDSVQKPALAKGRRVRGKAGPGRSLGRKQGAPATGQ